MTSLLLTALLPLLGVLIGGGLQYVSSRSLEGKKQLTSQKAQSYADYFKSFSLAAKMGPSKEVLSAHVDAKTRICLYGSLEVIQRLAEFERIGAKAENRSSVASLLEAMRRDVGASGPDPKQDDLIVVLFGPQTA